MQLNLRNIILPFLLTIQTFFSWNCYYKAQFLEYDDNYGLMLLGFVVSVVTLIIISLLAYYKPRWISLNRYVFILWFLAGSPFTFVITAIYYQSIFGATLAT
jgi:hypothetical protein